MSKNKKSFKMPHILWIMVGLLISASIMTYIIPAGKFEVDSNGDVLADSFSLLDKNTPISIIGMLSLILQGLQNSAPVIFVVMAASASMTMILESGSIDNILNWSIGKLKGKKSNILIVIMFYLVGFIGGFAGTDALIALVPIGLMFARKLKLDPILALGVTTFPAMIAFGIGPHNSWIPQSMMGIPMYSGFGMRVIVMILMLTIGMV